MSLFDSLAGLDVPDPGLPPEPPELPQAASTPGKASAALPMPIPRSNWRRSRRIPSADIRSSAAICQLTPHSLRVRQRRPFCMLRNSTSGSVGAARYRSGRNGRCFATAVQRQAAGVYRTMGTCRRVQVIHVRGGLRASGVWGLPRTCSVPPGKHTSGRFLRRSRRSWMRWSSAPGSPGCTWCTGCARPASACSAWRRATASAAPGTGTGTRARGATPSRCTTPTRSCRTSSRSGRWSSGTRPSRSSCATCRPWPSG